jgi:hypothetical protein
LLLFAEFFFNDIYFTNSAETEKGFINKRKRKIRQFLPELLHHRILRL